MKGHGIREGAVLDCFESFKLLLLFESLDEYLSVSIDALGVYPSVLYPLSVEALFSPSLINPSPL